MKLNDEAFGLADIRRLRNSRMKTRQHANLSPIRLRRQEFDLAFVRDLDICSHSLAMPF